MFKRAWVRITAAIVGIVTLVYVLWGTLYFLDYQQRHAYERSQAAADNSYSTKPYIEGRCGGIPYRIFKECTPDDVNAEQQEQREKADLKAQQDMSEWALFLALIGLPGLIISSSGLAALIWTFRETRKMTQADAKAYVEILHIEFSVDPTYGASLLLWLSNKGRTPASNIWFTGRIKIEHWEHSVDEPIWSGLSLLPGDSVRIAKGQNTDFLWRVGDVIPHYHDAGSHGRKTLTVMTEGDKSPPTFVLQGELEWFDIYGTRESIQIYEFAQTHHDHCPNWLGNMSRPGKRNPD